MGLGASSERARASSRGSAASASSRKSDSSGSTDGAAQPMWFRELKRPRPATARGAPAAAHDGDAALTPSRSASPPLGPSREGASASDGTGAVAGEGVEQRRSGAPTSSGASSGAPQYRRESSGFIRLRKESLYLGKDASKEPGLRGLRNLGNTCFMNAAVQCLSHTAPLTDFFIGGGGAWQQDLNPRNPLGTGGRLATRYAEMLGALWDREGSSGSSGMSSSRAFDPGEFKRCVSDFAPMFSGYDQHDCQELLVFLLDGLHEDLNRVVTKPYVEVPDAKGRRDEVVAAEHWANHLMRNKSIVVDVAHGQIKSTLRCHRCSHVSVTFDPFAQLSLPFPAGPGPVSVEKMLEEFLKPEDLLGAEAWYCPKCKQHVPATKKLDLFKLPPILIIHLKRFKREGRRTSKIETNVSFPLDDFAVSNFAQLNHDLPKYDLYAVSRHMGSAGGGHYTAVCKNRVSGHWVVFDDASATKVKDSQVQSKNAYVLFYQNHLITEQGYRRQSFSAPRHWPHAHTLNEEELRSIVSKANVALQDEARRRSG